MKKLTKRTPKLVAIIFAFALIVPIVLKPIDAEAAGGQWLNYSGTWYYELSNGNLARGWQYINSNWYYFNPYGQMVTGMQTIDSNRYYFYSSGAMATGWAKWNYSWYYFQPGSGAAAKGWKIINGNWYYFDSYGRMQTNLKYINSEYYYFDYVSGAMVTGWHSYAGDWYYFQPGSGAAVKNQWIGNYYLKSDGTMATNEWIGNYYVGPDGAWIPGYSSNFNGWYYSGGEWYYYTNGTLAYGHKTIGGITYYFDLYYGTMAANEFGGYYDEVYDTYRTYYYDSNGAPVTGWRYIYGNWFYFTPYAYEGFDKHEMLYYCWLHQGESSYYFCYEGYMVTGWMMFDDGTWYYFDPSSGAAAKNKWIGNYYLKADGRMATNEWIGPYYVGVDGAWIPGYSGSATSQGATWKTAYWNFIEENKSEYVEYALVYVDNDDIPELYLTGASEAAGDILCAYKNGQLITQHMNRTWGGSYIHKSGLFFNFNGNMGYYYANVYELTDNGFTNLFSGLQVDRYEDLGNGDYNVVSDFFVGDTQVSEEEFYSAINTVYNMNESKKFYLERVSYSTIKQQINNAQ